jgi:hypothetical protein
LRPSLKSRQGGKRSAEDTRTTVIGWPAETETDTETTKTKTEIKTAKSKTKTKTNGRFSEREVGGIVTDEEGSVKRGRMKGEGGFVKRRNNDRR